jgi:hypothetical protein
MEVTRIESQQLKFIVVRDNPDGSEMWRNILAIEIDTLKQMTVDITSYVWGMATMIS